MQRGKVPRDASHQKELNDIAGLTQLSENGAQVYSAVIFKKSDLRVDSDSRRIMNKTADVAPV